MKEHKNKQSENKQKDQEDAKQAIIAPNDEQVVLCHLANNDNGKTFYAETTANVETKDEDCEEECHTQCQICWTEDYCESVCEQDREYKIEGFQPTECSRPFNFCSASLSANSLQIGGISVRKKFHGEYSRN